MKGVFWIITTEGTAMDNQNNAEGFNNMREVDTYSAKCQGCGSTMVFDPETQSLKCEHCGTVCEIEKDFNVVENDITEGFALAEKWNKDEQVSFRCENCGAVVVLSVDEEASICPFCGATHIAKEGSFDGVRPHVVIPFQIGEEKAVELSKKWAKSRIFAPRKFKKSISVEKINGIYEPCFTFDSMTYSSYRGRVGDMKTRTVGHGKNRRTETYVDYRMVSGNFNCFYDDVLVATNENFTQSHLNDLAPFDTGAACVYEKKYLSGYMADGYQKNLDESWGNAKHIIDGRIRGDIKAKLHCDVVDYLNVETHHHDVKFKYMLLPIYTLLYLFKKKKYILRVNGSTGKVRGKTPVSPFKVAIASVLGAAITFFLVWLIATYG